MKRRTGEYNWKIKRLLVVAGILLCGASGCNLLDTQTMPSEPISLEAEPLQNEDRQDINSNDETGKNEDRQDIESTNSASIDEDLEITLVMVGDVLMHTPVTESGKAEDGSYHYEHLFANVKDLIGDADIALVNQEVILGGTELGLSGYPAFNAPYEVGDALADAGFDVVLHATNHALDKGEKGIRNCLNYWKEFHPEMKIAGIYPDESSYEEGIVYVEKQGMKIAVLNYTYGTNGIPVPKDAQYLVNLLDKRKIETDVKKAKEEADFVVLCPHWGTEYKHEPDASQKEWANYFADLGVDLVIGAHPHVIEPVEWVDSTLVYYSLGNFVNATSGTGNGVADRMLGAMAVVHLKKEGDKVIISDYNAIPLVSHLEHGYGNITVYPMEQYTEEMAKKNWIVEQDGNFSLAYIENVWEKVMQDENIWKRD